VRATFITLVLSTSSLAAPLPDPSRDEQKRLEGTWVILQIDWEGTPRKLDENDDSRTLTIKGDMMERKNSTGARIIYQITRLKEGRIDFVTKSGRPCIGMTLEGIYKLEGDSLWICYATLPRDSLQEVACMKKRFDNGPRYARPVRVVARRERSSGSFANDFKEPQVQRQMRGE
jgi:uncharacterized protein (TIGR03067 family)